MLAWARWIYGLFSEEALRLERDGPRLHDENGREIGRVATVRRLGSRLYVIGQAEGRTAKVKLGGLTATANLTPSPDGGPAPPFALDLPYMQETAKLVIDIGAGRTVHDIAPFPPWQVRTAHALTGLRLLGRLLRALPLVWTARENRIPAFREALGIDPHRQAPVMAPDALAGLSEASKPAPPAAATIVMPVFNAREIVAEALDRVARHSDGDWRIIVIDDGSTDPEMRRWLRSWKADSAASERIHLVFNAANEGFVAAANRGLAEARRRWPGDPVVILNSDAFVPPGWLSRLLAPLGDPSVASVTPMSNAAEILGVPAMGPGLALEKGEAEAIDAAARAFDPLAAPVEIPTGIGFCMAMSQRFLSHVPSFDPAFGRGYGEETDWCRKVATLGGRHLATPALFAEHKGTASFDPAEKAQRRKASAAEIRRRHTDYELRIADFIANDPLIAPRLALGLAWAAARAQGPVPVYIGHSLGGGAERDLSRRVRGEIGRSGAAVVLRLGGRVRWRLELHGPFGEVSGRTNDPGIIRRLLAQLPQRRVIYSCAVGDADPVTVPDLILALSGRGDDALPGGPQFLEVLLHDFFPISPSYTLLDSAGAYHGPPRAGTPLADDPAHIARRPGGGAVPLARWQAAWGRLVSAADLVTVFSRSSGDILAEVYPDAADRIRVTPHRLLHMPERLEPKGPAARPVIGVLGDIGPHKGAAVLQTLSRELARSRAARLVLLGRIGGGYRLARPAIVHGPYRHADIAGLARRYGITGWFVPSVWPETFSFVTHEALATGLPVVAFGLGAQGEAVADAVARGAPGGVLPLPPDGRVDAAALLALMQAAGQDHRRGDANPS